MLHYIIADEGLKNYYNEGIIEGLEYISQKYPTMYASEKEAISVLEMLDDELLSQADLKVLPIKLVVQSF